MKLLRAEFQNFRMLRDLKLEFSSDPDASLTVVRAANESGKTTILHGLQWALYGDAALPGKGLGFRLHPIDWKEDDGQHIPIMAMVEFELTKHRHTSGKMRETRRRYRLVRSASENVNRGGRRSASSVKLFALNETGASLVSKPASVINDELPPVLREVFFTDGDRALSFIEADVTLSTKRDRVRKAIRSLLGLGVVNDAIKHVRNAAAEVNKKAKRIGGSSRLAEVASNLVAIENKREELKTSLDDAEQQVGAFSEQIDKVNRNIATALQQGDKEKLRNEFDSTRADIRKLDKQIAVASKEHSALFRSQSLATDLLQPMLASALGKLHNLRDQGKIPNTTVPVLQERLEMESCICGETLGLSDPGGYRRREHIRKLISDSQRADEIQEIIIDLYYGAKSLPDGTSKPNSWLDAYRKVFERRDDLHDRRENAGRKLRELELKIDALSDTDIAGLRQVCRGYMEQRDRFLTKCSVFTTQLSGLKKERDKLEVERDRLLREQKRGARILAERDVTKDVMGVLKSAYERITNEELQKVSEMMNCIFLEMIGADPDQGAIIRRAEISEEFDIIVYGPNRKTLNPDLDLNGASRRALTLAFILALTKVSEVEAPNVIDTPLGMTSGFVKRSILRTAVRESAQLILFLTHDEIIGCEDIIEEKAGLVFTLTNPAHYPRMLVNDPCVVERKVLRCGCDHQNECGVCKRRTDAEVVPSIVS